MTLLKYFRKSKDADDRAKLSLSGHEPLLKIDIKDNSSLDQLFRHIQTNWEKLGADEPHWSVLTWDQFKSSVFGKETEDDFYMTGKRDAERLMHTLARNSIDASRFKSCLELGCGVGRITYWLTKCFDSVVGVDISKTHLSLAEKYMHAKSIGNVEFMHLKNPQDIFNFPKVDVVFSVIVIQHNPPPVMYIITKELLKSLNPGGVAFIQIPTYETDYSFSIENYLSEKDSYHDMEMHVLPQYAVFDIVQQEDCHVVEILEDACTGLKLGTRSNTFLIRKIE